jgi:hypothetical protein
MIVIMTIVTRRTKNQLSSGDERVGGRSWSWSWRVLNEDMTRCRVGWMSRLFEAHTASNKNATKMQSRWKPLQADVVSSNAIRGDKGRGDNAI